MKSQVWINEDKSENLWYNIPEFPVYIDKSALSTYPNYEAITHWHDDIELIYVVSGSMNYRINGDIITIKEQEGVFINSRQFHGGYSPDNSECIFYCLVFHPYLISSSNYIEKNFILPIINNQALPYIRLNKNMNEYIFNSMVTIYNSLEEKSFPLIAQQMLYIIWNEISKISGNQKPKTNRNQHLTTLKNMIKCISNNYADHLTLSDIADSGMVSKSTATTIFLKYTNKTPIAYLIEYRLKKSIEQLVDTDDTISQICYDVGFTSASYYTETFNTIYGITPTQYRKGNTK